MEMDVFHVGIRALADAETRYGQADLETVASLPKWSTHFINTWL